MRIPREALVVSELADGSFAVTVPGFDHVVDVRVEEVDGRPEIVDLRVRPAPGDSFEGGGLPYDPDTERPEDVPVGTYWRRESECRAAFIATHDRPGITQELLRSLPLGKIKQAVLDCRRSPDMLFTSRGESRLAAGGGLSDQFLRRVAEIYKAAVAAGRPPLVTIMEIEQVKKPTASKWVRLARKHGFLGYPDRPGRPGSTEDHSPWRTPSERETTSQERRATT